ncbi:CHASE2 domain-containing protein [Rhodoferax sp. GW822-FHT02A01]|uniref:CHASE2 domain-containing protein n=1 Tax=Rhodoferax sp. GW822-FHT02A01 TaxID=3141537 RepID=UPI00315DE706
MIAWLRRAIGHWEKKAGAWPAARVIWGLACIFCVWIMLDVFVLRFTTGISPATFDAMVRARVLVAAPDPRVLIIDIDEPSLQRMAGEFGRWPWPRDTLATVLDYLERQKPAAIVWDIMFSDADRISPGGDAAFNAAVSRSSHGHFSVVRLSPEADAKSAISRAVLPTLWAAEPAASASAPSATVAVIPPALPAIAASRLGYNNGYVDSDGVLRHNRALETLPDHSRIQSLALATLATVDPDAYRQRLAQAPVANEQAGELIAWRSKPSAYPRVGFADVFQAADTGKVVTGLPDFAGKVIVIGSAAASLHDVHPTSLAADHPGVDALATVLDNELHRRHLRELPRWLDALIAMALCLGTALWVQHRKLATLAMPTLVLPAGLLFVSYLSLNGSPVFVDLKLSAALALLFMALLRYWNGLRRNYWCSPLPGRALGLWPLQRNSPWLEGPLDHLIDLLEKHAPDCRLIVPDLSVHVLQKLRWPELGQHAAIVGPQHSLQVLQRALQRDRRFSRYASAAIQPLPDGLGRAALAQAAQRIWSKLEPVKKEGTPS